MRRRPQRTSDVVGAGVHEVMRDEFNSKPLGGYAGEMLPKPPPGPPQPAVRSLVIPPADWKNEPGVSLVPPEPPKPLLRPAIPPPPWKAGREYGLPAPPLPKLERPLPPPPDWRLEEAKAKDLERKERAKRERYERLLRLLDEEGT